MAALNTGNTSGIPGIPMLSQYSTKVKVRVGLGFLTLVAARVVVSFMSLPGEILVMLALICLLVGVALCIWGAISHAVDKGYRLPTWLRWLLVLPVALAVHVAIVIFLTCATDLLFWLAATRFAPQLDSPAADYPFMVVGLIVTSIAGSYCFVLAGATTAPKHRFVTTIVLGVCCLCGTAYLLTGLWFMFTFGMWSDIWTSNLMWVYVPWTGALVPVVIACAQVQRRESRMRATQQGMSDNSLEPTRT